MKAGIVLVLCGLLSAGSAAAAEKKVELKNQKEKASYAIGLDMGNSLKKNNIDVDVEVLSRGLRDALSGSAQLLTEDEIRETVMTLQQDVQTRQLDRNKKEGEAFLAQNKKKKGVVTLPSGLQYSVLKKGKGKSPKATDTVSVNYRGTLIDGTEFDSSYRRGQPATFPVNGVIPGWTEALQLMKVGDQWQLVIPSDLAYGERGAPPAIGPNSALIFEVELLSIESGAAGR